MLCFWNLIFRDRTYMKKCIPVTQYLIFLFNVLFYWSDSPSFFVCAIGFTNIGRLCCMKIECAYLSLCTFFTSLHSNCYIQYAIVSNPEEKIVSVMGFEPEPSSCRKKKVFSFPGRTQLSLGNVVTCFRGPGASITSCQAWTRIWEYPI